MGSTTKYHLRNSKWITCTLSTLLWIFGVCLLGIGIWLVVTEEYSLVSRSTQNLLLPAVLLITAGCLYLISSFFGCCGSLYENQCMTITCIVLTGLIMVLECISVGLILTERSQISNYVHNELSISLRELYPSDTNSPSTENQKRVSTGWDTLQEKFQCCGVDSSNDWFTSYHYLGVGSELTVPQIPDSCCISKYEGCAARNSRFHTEGCAQKLTMSIKNHLYTAAIVALVLLVFQVLITTSGCVLLYFLRRRSIQRRHLPHSRQNTSCL